MADPDDILEDLPATDADSDLDLEEEQTAPPAGVGRLVAPGAEESADNEGEEVGRDVGLDDGSFTAEEAAMHVEEVGD